MAKETDERNIRGGLWCKGQDWSSALLCAWNRQIHPRVFEKDVHFFFVRINFIRIMRLKIGEI